MAATRRKRLRQPGDRTGASMAQQCSRKTLARRRWTATPLKLAATGAALALALTACGGSSNAGGGGGGSSDDKGPLSIGISLPLTGDFSQPGGEARKGYEIWADEINKKGGLLGRKVDLKITDDASSQDTVVTDYTRLITQDKV